MEPTEQKLRDYYASQELPPEKVAAVLESGELVHAPWWRTARGRGVALAAAAAVVLASLAWLGWWKSLHAQEVTYLAANVAGEVAKAHDKSLAPEVVTTDYTMLQARLDRVDFPLKPKQCETSDNCTLLGGRYCSIQGELAAQLRLQKKDTGELYTLFVTRDTPELQQLVQSSRWVGEANVRFWHEGGRFYALAGPRCPHGKTYAQAH